MTSLFYFAIGALAIVLFVVDYLISYTDDPEKPTDCSEEDVPIVPTLPAITWRLDKDGKIHSSKNN